MKTLEKIHRLIEFMNIPVIDEKLSLKIREWEILFEPEIDEFRAFRQRFGFITDDHLYHEPFKTLSECKNIHAFRFIKASHSGKQLTGSWTLEIIRPPMEENQHDRVFQTDEFLQLLEESPEAPKFSRKIIESPNSNGKPTAKYKIWLQKVSVNVAAGMICFHDNNDGYFPFFSKDTGENITGKKKIEKKIQENMYLDLFRFMEDNPDVKDHIFFYLRTVLKPNALLKEKISEVQL